VIWGVVLAVALYPLHQKLKKLFKQRGTLAAVIITIISVLIIILPAIWLGMTTAREIKEFATEYGAGNFKIPPPTPSVKNWPVIGGKTYDIWSKASVGLDSLAAQYPTQVKAVVGTGLGLVASTSKGVLLLTASIIISGVFLAYSESAAKGAKALFDRLFHTSSFDMATISALTIRNVVKGILGVAVIQSTMAAIGFIAAGIPGTGLWVLCCLILAIVQIGTLPVAIPVIILAWSGDSTLTATLFTIWMVIVSISDNVLKPILLGKGAPVPMLVVFLGAIGGFILSGFIGLFTGAIVLSLGYKLFDVWLNDTKV
jgi:predicted PurR-regulated permease PerM